MHENLLRGALQAPVEEISGELRFKEWEFGTTIFLGESVKEREDLMAEIPVMILLEGTALP